MAARRCVSRASMCATHRSRSASTANPPPEIPPAGGGHVSSCLPASGGQKCVTDVSGKYLGWRQQTASHSFLKWAVASFPQIISQIVKCTVSILSMWSDDECLGRQTRGRHPRRIRVFKSVARGRTCCTSCSCPRQRTRATEYDAVGGAQRSPSRCSHGVPISGAHARRAATGSTGLTSTLGGERRPQGFGGVR